MKNVIIAAALAGTFASAAVAEGWQRPAVIGKTEYNITTEAWAYNAGVEVNVLPGLTMTPIVKGTYASATGMDFTGAELGTAYVVSQWTTGYVTLTTDDSWKYKDATVGVRFRF